MVENKEYLYENETMIMFHEKWITLSIVDKYYMINEA